MGQKIKTMVIDCPLQKREVKVTYSVSGNWFNREYDVWLCPAINDVGGGCNRQCKSLLSWFPRLNEWDFRRWLS
jgi:hypothetical protein